MPPPGQHAAQHLEVVAVLRRLHSVVQKGGAGPEGSGRPVLSLCESGEPRESAGVTAERWSQRQDPSPSGGAGAAGACYYTGALQHKGREKMILSGHRGSLYSLAASQLSAKNRTGEGKSVTGG